MTNASALAGVVNVKSVLKMILKKFEIAKFLGTGEWMNDEVQCSAVRYWKKVSTSEREGKGRREWHGKRENACQLNGGNAFRRTLKWNRLRLLYLGTAYPKLCFLNQLKPVSTASRSHFFFFPPNVLFFSVLSICSKYNLILPPPSSFCRRCTGLSSARTRY